MCNMTEISHLSSLSNAGKMYQNIYSKFLNNKFKYVLQLMQAEIFFSLGCQYCIIFKLLVLNTHRGESYIFFHTHTHTLAK